MKYIFLLLVLTFNLHATDAKFFTALHQIETGGRIGAITGDQGRSLGPYQISRPYWIDACKQNPALKSKGYRAVTEVSYSKQVVRAWLSRYCPQAVKSKDYETMARCHNGGPRGSKKRATLAYWNKFRKHL